jgi:hypothetical protein
MCTHQHRPFLCCRIYRRCISMCMFIKISITQRLEHFALRNVSIYSSCQNSQCFTWTTDLNKNDKLFHCRSGSHGKVRYRNELKPRKWYLKKQSVPQRKHKVVDDNRSRLMAVREKFTAYSENHTKHVNTLGGQNVQLLNIKAGGTYR